jgi:hypothetical protein
MQFGTARNVQGNRFAPLHLPAPPLGAHSWSALGERQAEHVFDFLEHQVPVELPSFIETHQHSPAVAVGKRNQQLGQLIRIWVRHKGHGLPGTVLDPA